MSSVSGYNTSRYLEDYAQAIKVDEFSDLLNGSVMHLYLPKIDSGQTELEIIEFYTNVSTPMTRKKETLSGTTKEEMLENLLRDLKDGKII